MILELFKCYLLWFHTQKKNSSRVRGQFDACYYRLDCRLCLPKDIVTDCFVLEVRLCM
jgi:hypothetical protein